MLAWVSQFEWNKCRAHKLAPCRIWPVTTNYWISKPRSKKEDECLVGSLDLIETDPNQGGQDKLIPLPKSLERGCPTTSEAGENQILLPSSLDFFNSFSFFSLPTSAYQLEIPPLFSPTPLRLAIGSIRLKSVSVGAYASEVESGNSDLNAPLTALPLFNVYKTCRFKETLRAPRICCQFNAWLFMRVIHFSDCLLTLPGSFSKSICLSLGSKLWAGLKDKTRLKPVAINAWVFRKSLEWKYVSLIN